MRALSVVQPWASLLAEGLKEFETRSWGTSYHGEIAIHASKTAPPKDVHVGSSIAQPRGVIIAVATLYRCYLTQNVEGISDFEREWGDWTPGRWAWALQDVRKLTKPVPANGALGLWDVPSDVEAAVRASLP